MDNLNRTDHLYLTLFTKIESIKAHVCRLLVLWHLVLGAVVVLLRERWVSGRWIALWTGERKEEGYSGEMQEWWGITEKIRPVTPRNMDELKTRYPMEKCNSDGALWYWASVTNHPKGFQCLLCVDFILDVEDEANQRESCAIFFGSIQEWLSES